MRNANAITISTWLTCKVAQQANRWDVWYDKQVESHGGMQES